MTKHMLERRL